MLTFDWRNGCPRRRTFDHTPEWANRDYRDRVKEIRFVPGSKAPEDMSAFFEDMFALRRVDFTNLDMSKTVSLAWMFNNSGFGDVEIVNLKAPNAKDCERLFRLGPDVTSLKVPGLDVSGAEVAREMFASWGIGLPNWTCRNCGCRRSRTSIACSCIASGFADWTSPIWSFPRRGDGQQGPAMFSNCVSLEHVDMPTKGALADRYGETMKRFNAGDRGALKARPYPRVTILAL